MKTHFPILSTGEVTQETLCQAYFEREDNRAYLRYRNRKTLFLNVVKALSEKTKKNRELRFRIKYLTLFQHSRRTSSESSWRRAFCCTR